VAIPPPWGEPQVTAFACRDCLEFYELDKDELGELTDWFDKE
jgi:hypothetical protein